MISSRSGHATGIFLPNWSPLVPASLARNSGGLLYLMGKLTSSSDEILRLSVSVGGAVDMKERMASTFAGEKVRDMYLPEWMIVDVTSIGEKRVVPRTTTLVSVAKKSDDGEYRVCHSVYAGRIPTTLSLQDFSLLMAKYRLEELWHRICGVVQPSWGAFHRSIGGMYVADCNVHFGVVSDYRFPVGYDMSDIGRIESFLQTEGIDIESVERSAEEIAAMMGTLDVDSASWSKAVAKIIETEKEKKRKAGRNGPLTDETAENELQLH